jgi:hypothetical protein
VFFCIKGDPGDFFSRSSSAGGCATSVGGVGETDSLVDCGSVSPARSLEVDVLDFLEAGRGKASSSSSSSSLGISVLRAPLAPLDFAAVTPAWSLRRARVELIAVLQRARGLKFSRRPGKSVSVDGVWMVSHYKRRQFHGGRVENRTPT